MHGHAAALLASLAVLLGAPAAAAPPQIVLRTAGQASSPKYTGGDEEKPQAGIAVEVMRAIEVLDPGLNFVGSEHIKPFARIQSELERGQLQVFFGMARTPRQEQRFTFLEPPLYVAADIFYVRADDPIVVNSLEDIRASGGGILTWEGTVQHDYVQRQGLKLSGTAKSIELGLRMLQGGRGRFWYGSELSSTAKLQELKLEGQIRPVFVNSSHGRYVVVTKPLAPDTQGRLSEALATLKQRGELDRIFLKYCVQILPQQRCAARAGR